jgi:hypothetical protein
MKTTPADKRRVPARTLKVGDECYPIAYRARDGFLRRAWRVARIDDDGLIFLKRGRKCHFINRRDTVLIDAASTQS